MKKRKLKLWQTLIDLGWSEAETDLLTLGNLTFSIEHDDVMSPGGAVVRQFESPWRPDEEEQPELIARFPIWLNHPEPIRKAIGGLSLKAVLIQINQVVLTAGCDIFPETRQAEEVDAPGVSNRMPSRIP